MRASTVFAFAFLLAFACGALASPTPASEEEDTVLLLASPPPAASSSDTTPRSSSHHKEAEVLPPASSKDTAPSLSSDGEEADALTQEQWDPQELLYHRRKRLRKYSASGSNDDKEEADALTPINDEEKEADDVLRPASKEDTARSWFLSSPMRMYRPLSRWSSQEVLVEWDPRSSSWERMTPERKHERGYYKSCWSLRLYRQNLLTQINEERERFLASKKNKTPASPIIAIISKIRPWTAREVDIHGRQIKVLEEVKEIIQKNAEDQKQVEENAERKLFQTRCDELLQLRKNLSVRALEKSLDPWDRRWLWDLPAIQDDYEY